MKSSTTTALFILGALASPLAPAAFAQAPRGNPVISDHAMSTSRIIGTPVYNDTNQQIGALDDVLVRPSGEPMAVLSVGKFVGHDKMVAVPMSHIKMQSGKLTMAGGTKEALNRMASFSYNAGGGAG